jgi:hypothetical protein
VNDPQRLKASEAAKAAIVFDAIQKLILASLNARPSAIAFENASGSGVTAHLAIRLH